MLQTAAAGEAPKAHRISTKDCLRAAGKPDVETQDELVASCSCSATHLVELPPRHPDGITAADFAVCRTRANQGIVAAADMAES
jgi:hypothetical protein